MLTIADKGGEGQQNVQQKEFKGTKNVDRENNWFEFTIYVTQSHITFKLDLKNEYPPFYQVKKSTLKIVVQKGQYQANAMLMKSDEGGREGQSICFNGNTIAGEGGSEGGGEWGGEEGGGLRNIWTAPNVLYNFATNADWSRTGCPADFHLFQ